MSEDAAPSGPAAQRARAADLVARMSVDEKAALCSGLSFWHLEANERLGMPSIMVTDGPHGLRKQSTAGDHVGLNASVPATCFPTASALASSWDRDLLREIGVALGEQCAAENVALLLGPGMNIKRHPLCGRNFEYFSEDPLVSGAMAAALVDGIQSQDGRLPKAELDRIVRRNVALSLAGAEIEGRGHHLDQDAHHALARRAAAECTVLLKNAGGLLPLGTDSAIAVIGAFAKQPRYQGAGSSQVTPTRLDCAFDAIEALVPNPAQVAYAPGYDAKCSERDDALIADAVAAARGSEVAIIFAGLPAIYESEGFDRAHMRLPAQHDRLIEAVCQANPHTVVVLANGAPVEMPWVGAPAAILEGYLAGQAGGTAIADVLFGVASPSGKLAETFPRHQADVPADRWFPGSGRQVAYREGLYVGYRYFDSADAPVLFPFGHGLTYTQFEYSNLRIGLDGFDQGGAVSIGFDITNTGARDGAEAVQLYVHDVESSVYRPEQELRTFAKVRLAPGETRQVDLTLRDDAFAVYDTAARTWVVEAGDFEIRVGASSRDIRLTATLAVRSGQEIHAAVRGSGPDLAPAIGQGGLAVSDAVFAAMLGKPVPPPESPRPYHVNSTLTEIAETWLGRQIKERAVRNFQRQLGVTDPDDTTARMFEEMANDMPLRALVLCSRERRGFRSVAILLAVLNKRFGRLFGLLARRPADDFPRRR